MSKALNLERFCCLQNQYSLLCRDNEWEVNEVCQLEGVAMLPWSPLKGGWLGGKMKREGAPEGTRVHHVTSKNRTPIQSHPNFQMLNTDKTWDTLQECEAIAKEVNGTIAQVRSFKLMRNY